MVRSVEPRVAAGGRIDEAKRLVELASSPTSVQAGGTASKKVPMRFARADERHVPEHWRLLGERQSAIATSPREAVTPFGALLNYFYALAEFECRLALLAVGLDPGLGWAHRDASYRDSAALDILEAVRPAVDEYLLQLLDSRTFSRLADWTRGSDPTSHVLGSAAWPRA